VKLYGPTSDGAKGRYNPAECIGARNDRIEGNPDPKHISTSFSERSNLKLRMHTRRFTRLTNAFSKKVENHAHAVTLHMMCYNFVRIHQTLRDGRVFSDLGPPPLSQRRSRASRDVCRRSFW
jgi:hypothetical protein